MFCRGHGWRGAPVPWKNMENVTPRPHAILQCPRLLPQSPSHQSKNISHDPPKQSGRWDATRTDFLQRRLHKQGALLLLRMGNNNKSAKIKRQKSFVGSRVFCLIIRKNNQTVHPRECYATRHQRDGLPAYLHRELVDAKNNNFILHV
jgi:hypothetical protein